MREGKSLFENKSQIRLVIMFKVAYIANKKMPEFQKRSPEGFYRKSCSKRIRIIHRKTPESLFNRVAGQMASNFIKRDSKQDKCFPVNIAKFLRTPILKKIFEQRYLQFRLLTVNISSQGLVSALSSISPSSRSSSRFSSSSLSCAQRQVPLLFEKNKNQPKQLLVTCRTASCHSLPLVVTCCESMYHSTLFYKRWIETALIQFKIKNLFEKRFPQKLV